MKKLGKKNHEVIETIEAYANCSGLGRCNCVKGDGTGLYDNLNDSVYNAVYYAQN
ncbi:CLI_3235 family bacteriocin precursor [Clostridium gasigenes]|uniref:CLI_3235 family bacteriocin precursor n=1 Tax=Clostridium gasigenes TaxID=94869 RepID=UPI001C0BD68C|nr:CLI_3235 family bacteriocin precursor [Clostridium gasigenes]MBU3107439.1 CLI_3235 family bacteriocin precursor [Clostridium gasigenes]